MEISLALLAAAACLVISARVWQVVSAQQPMWPIPAGYLIEMPALSALAAAAIARGHPAAASLAGIALGATAAFCVLAAFSVGLLYTPVAALLLVAGLLTVRSTRRNPLAALAWAAGAAITQTGIIFAAIRILYPG